MTCSSLDNGREQSIWLARLAHCLLSWRVLKRTSSSRSSQNSQLVIIFDGLAHTPQLKTLPIT